MSSDTSAIDHEKLERHQRASTMSFISSSSIWELLQYRAQVAKALLSNRVIDEERTIFEEAYNNCDTKICQALALPINGSGKKNDLHPLAAKPEDNNIDYKIELHE
jgi:hypothetical protein